MPFYMTPLKTQEKSLQSDHYLTLCALPYAPCLFTLAEVHGNRTHHGHRLPATGFEVQEAHQDLTTSI